MKPTAVIFDVDGTLANVSSILHYINKHKNRDTKDFKKDFYKFHKEAINVPPHAEVVDMVHQADADGHHIIVVTARKEQWRPHTSMWLALNHIPSHALFMRPQDDERKDYDVKGDILKHIQQAWEVIHAVDDNPNVIRLWEEQGIPTTKIGDWDGNY